MTADYLRGLLHAAPFKRFSVVLNNGARHDIPHPDFALLPVPEKRTLVLWKEKGGIHLITISAISEVVFEGKSRAASHDR